ncbi:MAG: dihydroorotase [Clostridiaceae bacterium]|nr:dihydroorotase [Clostridiaceae bacterium]
MKLLIKGGRVIDPASGIDGIKDILVINGKITAVEDSIEEIVDKVIYASGLWVTPGLIDLHVHLREPGFEHKETIESGSLSAARGGFTTICCMPNTSPSIDSKKIVDYIKRKSDTEAVVHVLPIGSITRKLKGEKLTDMEEMKKGGICGVSDDGKTVQNAALMKEAMKRAYALGLTVFSHCEDEDLLQGGVMNEGRISKELGLPGISTDTEDVMIARDIILARSTAAKLHICHVSTELGVQLVKEAKDRGEQVTAEVCPHHFTLTEEQVLTKDTNTKMNPPLRCNKDVEAIKIGLKKGVIEVIATDHAPHHRDEKNTSYEKAPFGIVGLETAVPLTITELVEPGVLTASEMIEKMTINPAKIIGIDKGTLRLGKAADITIINPNETYEIDINNFVSKSNNSPFHGKQVKGKVYYTIVDGKIVFEGKGKK